MNVKSRIIRRKSILLAAILTLVASPLAWAQLAPGWSLETHYLHLGQCIFFGQAGVQNGQWDDYDCYAPTGNNGVNGPGDVILYVYHAH